MNNGFQQGLISIEDPLDPTNDVGRSSYGAMRAKTAFEHAFVTLESIVRKGEKMDRYKWTLNLKMPWS